MTTALSKILLPLDGSEPCRRAVCFAACLAAGMGDRVRQIGLLHVLDGGYLSQHMANVDIRTVELLRSEQFQELRSRHIEETVRPFFAAATGELTKRRVTAEITEQTMNGAPADAIAECAAAGEYSTIIMARRGLSETQEFLVGSVTASLLHRAGHPTLYVVGSRLLADEACLLPRILILVDGSDHALAAVREAAIMAAAYGGGLEKIILLHVIDMATYVPEVENGVDHAAAADAILNQAMAQLAAAGVAEEKVQAMALFGDPVELALNLIDREQITLTMIGRRGRSAVQDLFIGGVSNTLLHRNSQATMGIVGG